LSRAASGETSGKKQGNEPKCNQVFKFSILVTGGGIQAKKNLRIRAGWCNS